MSIDLGRLLLEAGLVARAEVEAALFLSVVRGIPFPRALVDRGAITEQALEAELDRQGGLALRQVIGSRELFARLPRAMCRRLGAVPTRLDAATGAVEVAAADPLDRHVAAEVGFHLGLPVRVVRAPMGAIEEAIRGLELDERQGPSSVGLPGGGSSLGAAARARMRRVTPPFPHGAPQSTIPPPPSEELPIPLVRRAPEPPRREADAALPLREASLERVGPRSGAVPPTLRGPARVEAPPTVRVPSKGEPPPTARASVKVEPPPTQRGGPGRPPLLAEAESSPTISFPSSPPAAGAEGEAPPTGLDVIPTTLRHGRLQLPAPEPGEEAPAEAAPAEGAAEVPPAFTDLGEVLHALDAARSRDEVVDLSLVGLTLLAQRAALFTVKRSGFQGYACNAAFGDEQALREAVIPADAPSVLATATATGIYLGPVPGTPAHAPLLGVMGSASPDVAAVAARVAGRPVLVLVADELGDTMIGTRSMDELARAVGDALTRILAARQ